MVHSSAVRAPTTRPPGAAGSRARRRARPARGTKATDAHSVVLASGAFATLVRYFTVRPTHAPHVRALMRETGLSARSMQQELARMERLGLVTQERGADGRVRIRAVTSHVAWPSFRALVRLYALPADVLRVTVAGVPDIAVAFVFGSVARGDADEMSDCDLFVVTAPGASVDTKHAVVRALAVQTNDTSMALGREVSFVVFRPKELRRQLAVGRGFAARVLASPKLWVRGTEATLRALLEAPADADSAMAGVLS